MKANQEKFRQCNHIFAIDEQETNAGNLFLGSVGSLKPEVMEAFKFKAVLTIMDEYMYGKYNIKEKMQERETIVHLHLVEEDDEEADIARHFSIAHQFIEENLPKSNVLVHCQAGISRSATIVISFIMKKLKLSAQQATKYVRSRRYVASPNSGFCDSLDKYEIQLKKTELFKSKIPRIISKYSSEPYASKFCNHIACFGPQDRLQLGNLFLGQATAVSDICIKKYGFKAVLTLLDDGFYNRLQIGPKIEHLGVPAHKWIRIRDTSDADILERLQECHKFIKQNLEKGNVLVHCQMGVSRSASVVISYLMKQFKTDYYDALHHVLERRPQVKPNPGFEAQLRKYQKQVK